MEEPTNRGYARCDVPRNRPQLRPRAARQPSAPLAVNPPAAVSDARLVARWLGSEVALKFSWLAFLRFILLAAFLRFTKDSFLFSSMSIFTTTDTARPKGRGVRGETVGTKDTKDSHQGRCPWCFVLGESGRHFPPTAQSLVLGFEFRQADNSFPLFQFGQGSLIR